MTTMKKRTATAVTAGVWATAAIAAAILMYDLNRPLQWGSAGGHFTTPLVSAFVAEYATLEGQSPAPSTLVTLKGSMVCNGACIPDPKNGDHLMVLFAIDGDPEIRAEVDWIMKEY